MTLPSWKTQTTDTQRDSAYMPRSATSTRATGSARVSDLTFAMARQSLVEDPILAEALVEIRQLFLNCFKVCAEPYVINANLEFTLYHRGPTSSDPATTDYVDFQYVGGIPGPAPEKLSFHRNLNETCRLMISPNDLKARWENQGLVGRLLTGEPGSKLLVRLGATEPLGSGRTRSLPFNNVLFPCQFAQLHLQEVDEEGIAVAQLTYMAAISDFEESRLVIPSDGSSLSPRHSAASSEAPRTTATHPAQDRQRPVSHSGRPGSISGRGGQYVANHLLMMKLLFMSRVRTNLNGRVKSGKKTSAAAEALFKQITSCDLDIEVRFPRIGGRQDRHNDRYDTRYLGKARLTIPVAETSDLYNPKGAEKPNGLHGKILDGPVGHQFSVDLRTADMTHLNKSRINASQNHTCSVTIRNDYTEERSGGNRVWAVAHLCYAKSA